MRNIDEYHSRQYENLYRSTIHFVDWLEKAGYLKNDKAQVICDMACGGVQTSLT